MTSLPDADPATWAVADDWRPVVEAFWSSPEGVEVRAALKAEWACGAAVYPAQPLRALDLTPLSKTRVVILGQDPYHGPGQAEGLAFSVPAGVRHPPSLRNIFKERQHDVGIAIPQAGSLAHWAKAGVLLLNTTLTVRDGQAASHAKWGWGALTDAVMAAVVQRVLSGEPVVFMLWGTHAQTKLDVMERCGLAASRDGSDSALVLTANHPSPLSATRGPTPFVGCGHFGQARRWLLDRGVSNAAQLFENDSHYEQSAH